MLRRWGLFVHRYRRITVTLSVLSMVLAIAVMVVGAGSLSSSGFVDTESESQRVAARLADEFGRGREQLVFIFDTGQPVADASIRGTIETALAPVAADPRVARVLTTWNTGNPGFVSHDGTSTYAVALLNVDEDVAEKVMHDLTPLVEDAIAPAGMSLSLGGFPAVGADIAHEVEEGIIRAETVSIPLTIVISLLVFGAVIAAGLPLLVGGLAMVSAIAGVLALANVSDQSIFAVNIITMLGLALGVDYSLFMVARFREELAKRETGDAVATTMATTGKAILFSGITVIFGLAATFFFPLPALRSMGLAGMIVVAMALVYGLSFLPAMLSLLGPRINALPVRLPGARRMSDDGESRFWSWIATSVMRRPVVVLVPVLVALLLAGVPFLRLDLTPGGPDVLPASSPSRVASERLLTDFPAGEADPIPVLLSIEGDILSPAGLAAIRAFERAAAGVPHVTRVEHVLSDPTTARLDWDAIAAGRAPLPAEAEPVVGQLVRGDTALIRVVADVDGTELEQVVRDLRAIPEAGATVQVGGFAATSADTVDGIKAGLPAALLFVIAGSYVILLLTFGSVVLPMKAIVMTLLSISASLGALVLVFQDGRFENLLGFTATGEIISTTPLLMFCILFGLSMDYEVLMLSRIQEEYQRTADNAAAVAIGLEKTAKTITSAAAIMMVAFGTFMLADIVIIKSFGFGLMLAVLIDATIVRGLLVPSTMRLLGRWNWYAPRPITRAVERLGLSHGEAPAHAYGVSAAD